MSTRPQLNRLNPVRLDQAKRMRHHMTRAEDPLWARLRAGRLAGCRFRRQVPIGPYIADFVCAKAKLIVEVDGPSHLMQQEYDAERSDYLRSCGYHVIRFGNTRILKDVDAVADQIAMTLGMIAMQGLGVRRQSTHHDLPSP